MIRIKDINQVILKPDAVLTEVYEIEKSGIIIPGVEESADALDYLEVVVVGSGVTDLEKGDIILDMMGGQLEVYSLDKKKYALIYRGNVKVAVKADNFDKTKRKDISTDLSI